MHITQLLRHLHEDMMKRNTSNKSPPMRIQFRRVKAVYALIDEYAEWKFAIHPYQAGAYRSLLIRFVDNRRADRIENVTEDDLIHFIGGELTGFYSHQAIKAFRSFLWYAERAGYKVGVRYNAVSEIRLKLDHERSIIREKLMEARKPNWKAGTIPRWRKT